MINIEKCSYSFIQYIKTLKMNFSPKEKGIEISRRTARKLQVHVFWINYKGKKNIAIQICHN